MSHSSKSFATEPYDRLSAVYPFLFLFIFAAQALWHAREKSPTYDEPAHLTVSYLLAKTDDANYDIGHPPLVRALFALPLLILNPSIPEQMALPGISDSTPLVLRPGSALYFYSTYFLFGNRI